MKTKLKYIFFFTFFLVVSISASAQVNLDSLWSVWKNTSQHDTNRLNAMNIIAWDGYLFSQADSAFYFAQLQYNFAKEKGLKKYMGHALNTQGNSFIFQGDYAKAIDYHNQSLKITEELGDKKGIATSLGNIGVAYKNQGDYAKAIDYYTKSLKIREEIGDKKGIATSLVNIGLIYKEQGDYAKAIDYYTKSLKINEEIGDKQGIAISLNNIGIIYNHRGDYVKTIDYYTKALKIQEAIGDKQGIAGTLNNIGSIYDDQGDHAKAIDYYTKSLKIREEIGDKKGIANSLINIGINYYNQGNYAKALDYSRRALAIAKEVGAAIQTMEAAKSLWETNKALGKYKEALAMHELFITTRDTLESEENQKEVIRQEFKYNYEKKATADSVANAKANEIKNAHIAQQQAEIKAKRNQQYALLGGLLLIALFAYFMYNRFKITSKQKIEIEHAHKELGEKNKEILDSINYAKRIQSAILPPQKQVKELLPQSFILYKPKDIVAGDFYWLEQKEDKILFAAADCTGHGVPGAMVSVVCNNGLNRSVREHGLSEPGKILDKTREIVIAEFEKSEEEVKDGMDISLCSLSGKTLQWAGANNPIWIIRSCHSERSEESSKRDASFVSMTNNELIEFKPDKQPIGKMENPKPFTTHTIELQKGDSVYIFTDGYQDQFGGEKGKKFKAAQLKEILLSIQDQSMEEQKQIIEEAFTKWKGNLEQVDDVCLIGVRV